MPKLVVLMGQGDLAARLAPILNAAFPQSAFLIEEKEPRLELLRKRIRSRGLVTAFGQVAFRWVLSHAMRRQALRRDALWRAANFPSKALEERQVFRATSVNSSEARAWIAACAPDVVVAFSVRKLAPSTIDACRAPILNLHPGITPLYRGVHTGYWALRQNDLRNFGATVHLIDNNLDTGPIVSQAFCKPSGNIALYPTQLVVAGFPNLQKAVNEAIAGTLRHQPAGEPHALYFEPTLWSYVAGGLRHGVW